MRHHNIHGNYTIVDLLQRIDMYVKNTTLIKPENMIEDNCDYIFGGNPFPHSEIPSDLLIHMKKEFEYR